MKTAEGGSHRTAEERMRGIRFRAAGREETKNPPRQSARRVSENLLGNSKSSLAVFYVEQVALNRHVSPQPQLYYLCLSGGLKSRATFSNDGIMAWIACLWGRSIPTRSDRCCAPTTEALHCASLRLSFWRGVGTWFRFGGRGSGWPSFEPVVGRSWHRRWPSGRVLGARTRARKR
jgi:hypothetical protein